MLVPILYLVGSLWHLIAYIKNVEPPMVLNLVLFVCFGAMAFSGFCELKIKKLKKANNDNKS